MRIITAHIDLSFFIQPFLVAFYSPFNFNLHALEKKMAFLAGAALGAVAVGGGAIVANEVINRPRYVQVVPVVGVASPSIGDTSYMMANNAYDTPTTLTINGPTGTMSSLVSVPIPADDNDVHYDIEMKNYPPVELSHSKHGWNHPWLHKEFGKVTRAEFCEEETKWINFDDFHRCKSNEDERSWWVDHCKLVSHHPHHLFDSHMDAYVRKTRFAVMRLTFDNGSVYQSDLHPKDFEKIFLLEQEYHANACKKVTRY